MATLAFSPNALDQIRALPSDDVLLQNLWAELEEIADDLEGRTIFPPPAMYRRDRRFASFFISDGYGNNWGFSVTLSDRGEVVTVHSVAGNKKAHHYPDEG